MDFDSVRVGLEGSNGLVEGVEKYLVVGVVRIFEI